MKKRISNQKVLMCLMIASVMSIIFIILAFSKFTFHSDCMGYLLQAKEQVKQLSFFPDRFHYTTAIWGFSTSVFMVPFVKVINNDFLLHEMGSILALLFLVMLVLFLFRKNLKYGLLVNIIFCIPISYTYNDMLFFQSAYINACTLIVMNLICITELLNILESNCKFQNTDRRTFIIFLIYFLVVVFTNYCGVGNYIYIELPVLLAFVILFWMKRGANIIEWIHERHYVFITMITILGILFSFFAYRLLCARIGFDILFHSGGMVDPYSLHDYIQYPIQGMLNMFGICSTDSLMSFQTIKVCMCIVYFVINIFIAPIILVKNLKKFKSDVDKFIILFCTILCYVVLFLILFGGMREARYFLPAMFGCIILTAYFVVYLKEHYTKQVGILSYLAVFVLIALIHGSYYLTNISNGWYSNLSVKQIVDPTIEDDLVNYLESQELNYGYATFWQAYHHMVKSNSEITIAAYDEGNPLKPYYFNNNNGEKINYYACSEDLYSKELHPGKCFVLVAPGEVIPEKYYEVAIDIQHKNGYVILIFEKNIQLYEELTTMENNNSYICQDKEDYGFDFSIQEYGSKTFCQNNSLYILQNGGIELNYVDMLQGEYEITVIGTGLDDISLSMQAEGATNKLSIKEEQRGTKVFLLGINKDTIGNKLELENKGNCTCKVTSIVIKRR